MQGNAEILNSIPDNGRTTSDVLLGVYQYAYTGRLADVLASDHPLLKRHMGDGVFEEMAFAYIAAHPSDSQNVRWFARKLPGFLKSTDPYAARTDFYELALLEQALANAFDAADDAVLTLADLQTIAPEDWAMLTFQGQASVTRLSSHHNTFARWQALEGDVEPPPV